MSGLTRRFAIASLALALASAAFAQKTPYDTSDDPRRVPIPPVDRSTIPALVIRGGTLLDGYGKAPVPNSVVVIRGDRIVAAGPATAVAVPEDVARTIDARGMWIMPGMVDVHIHLSSQRGANSGAYPNSDSAAAMRATELLDSLVRAGITTVTDRGTQGDVALRLKEAVARGLIPGPRIFWSGAIITTTGGHTDETTATATGRWLPEVPNTRTYTADGPWEWRKAVRVQIRRHADWIKVAAPFTKEEVAAAVDEAHQQGMKVTVDSFGKYTLWAIEAGIDSVEHPLDILPQQVPMLASHKTAWNPTLVAFDYLVRRGYPSRSIPPGGFYYTWSRRFPLDMTGSLRSVEQAYRAGVRIGVGTDVGSETEVNYPRAYFDELALLHKAGLPIKAVLASATRVSADILGMGDKLGTIEPGKIADVLLLGRNPEESLANLEDVKLVVAGGKVVAPAAGEQPRPAPAAGASRQNPNAGVH